MQEEGAQVFFSLREGGGARFMLFLSSSQHVSQVLNVFPIVLHFIPYSLP